MTILGRFKDDLSSVVHFLEGQNRMWFHLLFNPERQLPVDERRGVIKALYAAGTIDLVQATILMVGAGEAPTEYYDDIVKMSKLMR